VKAHLEPFLPTPVVVKDGETYALDWKRAKSIGKLLAFWGNFGMHVRAYAISARWERPVSAASVRTPCSTPTT